MNRLFALLAALALAACTHTAVAPLSNPQGQIVVAEIKGARPGKEPDEKTVRRLVDQLGGEFTTKGWPLKYFSDFDMSSDEASVAVVCPYGDMETKDGRKFVGALPVVGLNSNKPAETTENALRAIVADIYRNARKKGLKLIPVDQLKEKPKEAKP